MAAQACERALEAAAMHADEVDLVLLATSTPMWRQPATAVAVHEALGLRADAGALDLGAVCCGFVYGLQAGSAMLAAAESWTSVLVVGSEHYSAFTDPADRGTRIFFGDGAGAVVLRKQLEVADLAVLAAQQAGIDLDVAGLVDIDGGAHEEESAGIRSIAYGTNHAGRAALQTELGAPFHMDGPAVRGWAVPALEEAVRAACDAAGIEVSDLALLVPHQSNRRMLEAAVDALGLPEGRCAMTVERYGNTAGASIPITLDDAARSARMRAGDLVCLAGYGSGLQAAACIVRWGE
jgi:3-oxoacyl-[acyl-carrier-protein] synthase-3